MLVVTAWHSSSVLIRIQCEAAPLAFSMRGRIVEVANGKRIRFLSVDGASEFVFDLREDFECMYSDPRDFPEQSKTDVCALLIFFSRHAEYASDKDFITFSELA